MTRKATITTANTVEAIQAFNAISNEKEPIWSKEQDWDTYYHEVWLPWKDAHNKRVIEARKAIMVPVGHRCTVVYYSDRRAATVTKVMGKNKVAVRLNKVKCLDYYGGKYEILPELDDREEIIFTRRSNGAWVESGSSRRDGVHLNIFFHSHYIDPSF